MFGLANGRKAIRGNERELLASEGHDEGFDQSYQGDGEGGCGG